MRGSSERMGGARVSGAAHAASRRCARAPRAGAKTGRKDARLMLCCFYLLNAHRLVVVAEHRTARRRVPLPLLFEVVPVEVVRAHCTGGRARGGVARECDRVSACEIVGAGAGGLSHTRTKWRGTRELALRHDDLLCCCGTAQQRQHSCAEQQRCDALPARHF